MEGWGWTPHENFNLHNWRLNLLKKLITENMRETHLLRQTKVSPPTPRKIFWTHTGRHFLHRETRLPTICLFCREDLSKLTFLTQCIKEGMRLHCPVPFVARNNTVPLSIEGHTIPPGTFVVANIWCLHHNPAVWGPDHMQYKPERFSKDNLAKLDSFAFLPFSAGPRYLDSEVVAFDLCML